MRLCPLIAASFYSFLFLLCLGTADGQIVTGVRKGGKTMYCLHTGLTSHLRDCGVRSDWYTFVFIGSISAITAAPNDEKRLQIHPEEIFHGSPPPSLRVLTSQAACLPSLAVGDRWLFYLRQQSGEPIVLDYYANDSLPVASADAKEQIATLRRLETIGDRGILRGRVWRGGSGQDNPVAHAVVVARGSGNRTFVTRADANGHFEFPQLPAGSYEITARPIGSFRPEEVIVDISSASCWDVTLTR